MNYNNILRLALLSSDYTSGCAYVIVFARLYSQYRSSEETFLRLYATVYRSRAWLKSITITRSV